MTDKETQRARLTINELFDDDHATALDGDQATNDTTDARCEPRVETRNQRHVRELAERDEQWAQERRREQKTAETLEARIERRMQAEIGALRKEMIDVVATTGKAVEAISSEIDRLHDIVRLPVVAADKHVEETLSRIERMIGDLGGSGSRGIADLPNPLRH